MDADRLHKIEEELVTQLKLKTAAEKLLAAANDPKTGGSINRQEVEAQYIAADAKFDALARMLDEHRRTVFERESKAHSGRPNQASETDLSPPSTTIKKEERKVVLYSSSDLLAKIRDPQQKREVRVDAVTSLVKLMKKVGDIDLATNFPLEESVRSLRACVLDPSKELRMYGYRALRHMTTGLRIIKLFFEYRLDIFIVRSLTRDIRFDEERVHAIKLIRSIIDVPEGADYIPQSIVRILVSIVGQADESFRNVCLETLCEIAIRNAKIVTYCGGMKAICLALAEGPKQLNDIVVKTVLYLLDRPSTRKYVRLSTEAEVIVSCFMDAFSMGIQTQEDRLAASSMSIIKLLKSWTGLIYLCTNNKLAIRSIVNALQMPMDDIRKLVLDMLFDIFRVDIPQWFPEYVASRKHPGQFPVALDRPPRQAEVAETSQDESNLVDMYMTMLLTAFIEVGVLEALIEVIKSSAGKAISTRATILIGQILALAHRLLPASVAIRIQSLSSLFQVASDFGDEKQRYRATLALSHMDRFLQNKDKLLNMSEDSRRSHHEEYGAASSRQLEDMRTKMGLFMDDAHFRNLLNESEVIGTKEYPQWNWDAISQLIQGPLKNLRRLDDTIKNTKFVRRLLAFFRPSTHQFSDIKKSKGSQKFSSIASDVLILLLQTTEGQRALMESRILQEIVESVRLLDPGNGQLFADSLFGKDRMEKSLTPEYINMLGVLMKHSGGIGLLERFRVFTVLYKITELRGREDLVKLMLSNMNYDVEGHPRIILSKVLTSGNKEMRLYATELLCNLLRDGAEGFSDWGVRLMVPQIYDPSVDIREKTSVALKLACEQANSLETVIELKPKLELLEANAEPILLRVLGVSSGFSYLHQLGYVQQKITEWFEFKNMSYVVSVELSLDRTLHRCQVQAESTNENSMENVDARAQLHFYGQLTKTEEGTRHLRETGHFDVLANYVRKFGLVPDLDSNHLIRLKAALWAVGNIGSTKYGLELLQEAQIIQHITKIAEESPILSLKGTAYFVIGLISKTANGAESLLHCQWETVNSTFGRIKSESCIPSDPSRFLQIPVDKYEGSWAMHLVQSIQPSYALDDLEEEVIRHIGNMSNHIHSYGSGMTSTKVLSRMFGEAPEYFQKPELYLEVFKLQSLYHYRLAPRRFFQDLFERVVFENDALDYIDTRFEIEYDKRESGGYFNKTTYEAEKEEVESVREHARIAYAPTTATA
ncbi:Rapamycin-insensitive companion of mTOR, N-term-domain-containing protein [Polychytrium aggregatum]|uniref:Rapamycin-insensitive companion of mTOR, N-term-domain-containing protein n=1 Tax=Polychytrium aggregatum TaxID=110093 RepID=UPI0022FE96AF|nr:Rapamycin-insensitive companion of mTOR, N-term-domain-containing protein [Polychytrium aggregatum]KAI9208047.1 Rapamycin-insensitive companion of mTOR, N-term-domain-containing protein [Polychytrium aggregatum]